MGVTVREKKRGSGKWYVFVSTNGRRTSKLVGNKKTAQLVADKLRARLALGQNAFAKVKPSPTFSEYAHTFLNGYVKNSLKPSTHRSYNSIFNIHLLPNFRAERIVDITREHIKNILIEKSATLSRNRIKRIQSCISSMMTMAIEDGIITANPAAGLQKYVGGRETTATPDPYRPDELQIYLQTCINRFPSYYPFFLSLACTGMRLGEAIALNWGDIDFHSRFIVVSKTITEGIEGTPKTGASRRVPMTIELAETLKRLRTTRKKQTISNGWQAVPDRIFITDTATTYHPANLTRRVHNKITEYAGLRRIRLHDFRHTYATIRLNKGDAIQKVSKALGHKNVHITIGTYMHYITEADQDDVDALDSLFVPTAQTKKNAKEAY